MLFDVIIIGLIALSTYVGYKNGFVKTVSKLLSVIISLIFVKLLHPLISSFVRNSFIGDFINDKIAGNAQTAIPDNMPIFIQKAGESVAFGIADVIITIITILIIFKVASIVAGNIITALDLVAKLPLISSVNKWLGLAGGLIMSFFWIYVLLALVLIFNLDSSWLDGSMIAYTMFKNNIIMNLIF